MRKALAIIGVLLCLVALPFSPMLVELMSATTKTAKNVREGDVIFQTSQSEQSPLIKLATRSVITHCGIIVMKSGKPYVLETLRTLQLTPLNKFIARGKGGRYWLKRSEKENIKIEYAHYLGKSYDLAFSFNNDIYYCSELVYDIYKKQLGIELCEPKKVGDYMILGVDKLPWLKKAMKKRDITKQQYAVAPVEVFRSDNLKLIK